MAIPLPLLAGPTTEPRFTPVPQDVSLEITHRCNLRCRHCFNESAPGHPDELPLERILALLDEIRGWGVRAVRVTGGEPTVHSHFREILAACRDRGIGVGLNTNGVYAEEMLEYLTTAPVDVFFVSLDGMEANHEAIRGRGTFRRAVESISRLRAAGRKTIIGFHLGEGNRGDLAALVALAAELGADFKMAPLRPVGRAVRELPRSLIAPRDFHAAVRELTHLRRVHPGIRLYTDFDLLEGAAPDDAREPEKSHCKAGRTLMNVRADGAINPCAFFDQAGDEFVAGNVHRDSATEVWQRPDTFAAFRTHRKADACQECGFYQRRCNGGCPAIAHATTVTLDALDPTCFAAFVQPEPLDPAVESVPPLAFARFVTPPERDES